MLFFFQEKSMRLRNVWIGTLGVALAASVVACGGGEPSNKSAEPSAPGGTPSGEKVDTSKAGTVTGTVSVEGAVPKNEAIKMNADPVCIRENKDPQFQETYVVSSDGKTLGNVFVYVKDGLGNYVYDTPTEKATIDQKQCRYHPHVFGMRVNQPLEIINSDPTLHNIHAMPKGNSEFNNGQPIQGMKMTHTFGKPEVMVPFKCDVHSWMNAYVGVLDHPYFAVTKDDGKFELKDVPAGTYTVTAWHEKLGTQDQKVTLGEKESKEVNFTFKAAGPTATNNN
jgi:carboxypeptidase family protein